jgi:hydroxymethylbilane synthase
MLTIALRPDGRRVVIVGGGNVAARKAETLVDAGFQLLVIAPAIGERLRAILERCGGRFEERAYRSGDFAGAMLAIVATDDETVNASAIADARDAGILAGDATDGGRGDFIMPAVTRVGDLTFSVDSGGGAPSFSKRIVREIETAFGPEYAAAGRTLARMRTYAKIALAPAERTAVMRELSDLPVAELATMNPIQGEDRVEAAIERLRAGQATARTSSVVCASRASALAMTQTRAVAARLARRGIATTILDVTTTGDRDQSRPIHELGGINVFVTELERALRERRADYAVHSCKDLPSDLPADMELAAISAREDARDAYCSERYATFEDLPAGATIGTSSPRRRAQLKALRPDLRYEEMRGNVDTRLRKLKEGHYDAIVLAMAGLRRLHIQATHTVAFSLDAIVPAVAQGALAVETRIGDELARELHAAVNDAASELCVRAERAALRALRAGCSTPIGIHARLDGDALLIDAAYATDAGILRERMERRVTDAVEAEALGTELGLRLAARAGGAAQPSLAGKLVVLPRTQERPSRIAGALRERGVDVVELREGDAGPDASERAPDMLLFPSSGSVAAAQCYLERLRATTLRPLVAAMGPRSSEAARAAGFTPDAVAPDASIEAFVRLIEEHLSHR